MKLSTGDEIHQSEGKTFERTPREFVKLAVYNNFDQNAPKEVTLHNCVIDGDGALRFSEEKKNRDKYDDKLLLFLTVFDDEGGHEDFILKEDWGKADVFNKSSRGKVVGSELRKALLVDPNETANPKVKEEYLFRPFWIKKFAVKGQSGTYHNVQIGFEEGFEIPDHWIPFMLREAEGATWADVKDDPVGHYREQQSKWAEARGNKKPSAGSGQKQPDTREPAPHKEEPTPDTEAEYFEFAAIEIEKGTGATKVAAMLATEYGLETRDALRISHAAYNRYGRK
jgi:hypothetical protein